MTALILAPLIGAVLVVLDVERLTFYPKPFWRNSLYYGMCYLRLGNRSCGLPWPRLPKRWVGR